MAPWRIDSQLHPAMTSGRTRPRRLSPEPTSPAPSSACQISFPMAAPRVESVHNPMTTFSRWLDGKALYPHDGKSAAFVQSSNAMAPMFVHVTAPPPHAWAMTGRASRLLMIAERNSHSAATLSIVKRRKSMASV